MSTLEVAGFCLGIIIIMKDKQGCTYMKDKEETMIHKDTVLYVGIELQPNKDGTSLLRTSDHEDILCTAAL